MTTENGELLQIDVLYWMSHECVVGVLDSGCVYHFWMKTAMSTAEATRLGRATPTKPLRALLCGGLRWDAIRCGFECDGVRAM